MSLDPGLVRENLDRARERIAAAAARAGRAAAAVELVAATKYVDASDLPALAAAGVRVVGENRTDALLSKQALYGDLFEWHFIGHLQSRKARDLVGRVRLVHSLSSLSAAEQLHARSPEPVACLLEVNVAGEESKSGVPVGEVAGFLEGLEALDRVRLEGLMTMPPLTPDPEGSRGDFAALRELAAGLARGAGGRHSFTRLSMGTSQDFEVAVEEGATLVRLGSVLYDRPSR